MSQAPPTTRHARDSLALDLRGSSTPLLQSGGSQERIARPAVWFMSLHKECTARLMGMPSRIVRSTFPFECNLALLFPFILTATLWGSARGTQLIGGGSNLATIYYVDASSGDDSNSGLSSASPWKTLAKVNATVFWPSDKILFRSGSAWTGQLW